MKSKIQKILSIPPLIALKKLIKAPFKGQFDKLKHKKEKLIIEDYIKNSINIPVNYFDIKFDDFHTNETLQSNNQIQNLISHKFDLLGSGEVKVAFNSSYGGFLGNNYSHPIDVNQQTMIELLPKIHQEKSKKIQTLISSDYEPIDWYVDFRSGYRWDTNYYKFLKYGNIEGADIKVPWELARLQHIFLLSFCCGNADENLKNKLIKEIQNQLLDFISQNPPFYGPNWISPMEVSIRSVNIVFSLIELKRNNIDLPSIFEKYLHNYLWASYRYLQLNDEWNDGLRNNHYLANLLGLTVLSKFFERNSKFQDKIYQKFKTELEFQFFDDGANFEGSLPYHFFAFEIVFWLAQLFLDKILNDKKVLNKLSKITNFNNVFIKHNLENIQIGDNDSGKILNINYLYDINYNFNILSDKIANSFYKMDYKDLTYNIFCNFGLLIINRDNLSTIISTGRKSQSGKGGHNHNDSQSFILFLDNVPIVVDPGTFVYTASKKYRNLFRSSLYHNKLSKSDANEIDDDLSSLFWYNDKQLKFNLIEQEEKHIVELYDKSIMVKRKFFIDKKELRIEDKIENYYDKLKSSFHLHPNCQIEMINLKSVRIINNEKQVLFNSSEEIEIEDYLFSPSYGKVVDAKKIIVNLSANKTNKIEYSFKK